MSKTPTSNRGLKAKIIAFFETRLGHGALALAAIFFGYLFVTLAIDTGSLLDWLIAIILTIIAVRETAAFIRLSFQEK